MAKKKKAKEITVPEEITVSVEWHIPDDIITRFATNMLIQTIQDEFKLLFFEAKPPLILSAEDRKKLKDQPVRADCVGSFIITAEHLKRIIDVLSKQLDNYNQRHQTKQP